MLDPMCQQFLDRPRSGWLYAHGMDLAAWVRAARAQGKLTMQQLADQLGRSKGAVWNWEHNKDKPSFAQMMRISELTGYPLPPQPDGRQPGNAEALTGTEGLLIGLYRALDERDRAAVLHEVRERAARYKTHKKH